MRIDVVAAVIEKNNKILIAQRAAGKHLEYKWEFPGGKIEKDETDTQTLFRELKEELNITSKVKDPICSVIYKYPTMEVNIKAYYVQADFKNLKLSSHEAIKWVEKDKLLNYDLAPADILIANKILEKINE